MQRRLFPCFAHDRPHHTGTGLFKATDNTGAVTTSAAVGVTVTIPNVPPTVSLIAPLDGATFTAPATITVTANATDSDGSITQVQFYDSGTTLLTTDTTAPYTFDLVNVGAGTYNLTAKATDNNGAQTTSSAIQFTVTSGTPQAYYIHTDQLNTPRLITDIRRRPIHHSNTRDLRNQACCPAGSRSSRNRSE